MEVVIKRTGECRRCGYCCSGCVHLSPPFEGVKPGFYKCEIYERRNEYCEQCGRVHNCEEPDYPRAPIRFLNPYCGYRFYGPSGSEIIRFVYTDWDWLSQHGGK